jgi:predicted metal-dependent phosphotriesterase family hydrolase
MHEHLIPDLLAMGATEAAVHTLFVDNSRRFLSGAGRRR